MKRFRLLFVVAGAVVVLLLMAVAIAFNSSFQTWVVRREIAKHPELRLTVGSVSAGLGRVELRDVRFVQDGAIMTLPALTAGVRVFAAAFDEMLEIKSLVAEGWTLDLTQPAIANASTVSASAKAVSPDRQNVANTGATPRVAPATSAAQSFAGVFTQLRVPIDLSVDGVRLEGVVILPESRGRVTVKWTGGGLRTGRDGSFNIAADAALGDEGVKSVALRAAVIAAMDTPRSFSRLEVSIDASATGKQLPEGASLHADLSAAQSATGETYSASMRAGNQNVITAKAALPRNSAQYEGAWQVNVRDIDVAPFAFGQPLPAFTAVGEGKFAGDARFETVRLAGRLDSTVARLESITDGLAGVGSLKIASEFDLAEREGSFVIEKFEAVVTGEQPVATVRASQAFEFNPGTGELRTADAKRELIALSLHGVPVAWAAPFVKDFEVTGGRLQGEISALPRGGGMAITATSPLVIDRISVSQAGKPLVQGVDVALRASADYTPKGWQAEVSGFRATSGDATLLSLDAKIGQLAGQNQSLKATGTLSANLPSLFAQPAAAGHVVLTSGRADVEFVLSSNAKKELQATLGLKDLATVVDTNAVELPALSTKLRADISTDGQIAFNAPIQIERSERKSDVTIIGTISPEKNRLRGIDAEVTSTRLVIEDAQVFAAVLPDKSGKPPATSDEPSTPPTSSPAEPTRDTAPPWAGLHGSLGLQLKSIIYSDAVQVSNVTGRLRIDAGMMTLEGLQAGLGETGRANVNGKVTFNPEAPQPYALTADVALREFDPGPLLRAMTENQPATVEGRFDITSKLAGRGASFSDLVSGAGGSFQLTSKGGVFRGLPVDVSNIVESTSKLAAWIASAGTAITAMAGKKDTADVANKAEAVVELARGLNPIPFDQLSVSVARDAALNTTLRNFTLISPEVRLTGSGTALHKAGSSLLEDSLAMEFTLRARGRQGELLKYLGALEPQTDELGYAACTVPLRVEGSLGRPDTSELNHKLAALAIEKSGFGDKAAEFLNKIRGGK